MQVSDFNERLINSIGTSNFEYLQIRYSTNKLTSKKIGIKIHKIFIDIFQISIR